MTFDPDPGSWNRASLSGAITLSVALLLVIIGGQCRGSLAQERVLDVLSASPVMLCPGDERCPAPPKPRPKTPMTAAEWTRTYDECVAHLGTPIVLAGRHPGLSAGVGCIPIEVLGP